MSITAIPTFYPATEANGSFPNSVGGDCITVHLLNESLQSFWVTDNAGTLYALVPALWAQVFSIRNPPDMLYYTVFATQNAVDTTLQQVDGAIYSSDEDTSKLFSGPLPRIANVGNPSSVNTGSSTANTLSNEGGVAGTLVIDIGDNLLSKLFQVFSDHFVFVVDQSGTGHYVLRAQTSGNPLLIGQIGDTTEVAGALTVDQAFSVLLNAAITGNLSVTGTSTLTGAITAAAANSFGAVGNTQSIVGNATIGGTLGVTGAVTHSADTFLVNKKLSTSASGDLADWSGAGVTMKGNPSNHGKWLYFGDGTHQDWSMAVIGPTFTGTGGGTFNHSCKQFGSAIAPNTWIDNPCTASGSSNELGFGTATTTQVTIVSLNSVAWIAQGVFT